MSSGESDAALVQRARQGSKEAFGQLVVRYRGLVVAVAYRMTGSAATAEDVAQVVFLRAWMQLASLHDAAAFRGWLYRLAVSASIDQLRRSPQALPLAESQVGDTVHPEGETLARERAQAVRHAVLALPNHCRAALVLREFEGLSYKEISQVLDIPVGTVMSRLSYARTLLKAALGAHLSPPGRRPVEE